jgi:predicted O-methyltransferase YrrM
MEKVLKVLKKIEALEGSWQCEITRKIDSDGKVHIYRTHLRSVSPLIGKFLSTLVLIAKPKTILELGCSGGYSTLWMSIALEKGHIYTTEILKEKIAFAKENFKEAGVKNITILEGDITETLKKWKKPVDFIFIDADKDKYLRYYDLVFPFLKKGEVIVADNVISHENILKPFLDKVKSDKRIVCSLVKMHSGLMIIYKIKD